MSPSATKYGIKVLLIIDFLQLMTSRERICAGKPGTGGKYDFAQLKIIAKELNIPVIALFS